MNTHCQNCQSTQLNAFCAKCGQRVIKRLSPSEVVHGALGALLDTDQGLIPTLRNLALRPGKLCADYIAGQRRRYLNPVTFFLFAATFYYIEMFFIRDILVEWYAMSFFDSEKMTTEEARQQATMLVERLTSFGIYMALVFACAPYAALLRLFNRRSGLNFVELYVFSTYTYGFCILMSAVALTPFINVLGVQMYGFVVLGAFCAYGMWAGVQLFGRWWHALTTGLAFLIAESVNGILSTFVLGVIAGVSGPG